jgi:ABC-type cobalt transport system substrate-binding protein
MASLDARVHQLESTAPMEEIHSLLFLAAVSVGATLITIGIILFILSVFRARRKREKERNDDEY